MLNRHLAQVAAEAVQPPVGHHIPHGQQVKVHPAASFLGGVCIQLPLLYAIFPETKREKTQKLPKKILHPLQQAAQGRGTGGMGVDFLSQLRYNVCNYVRKGGGWMSSIG